MTAFGVYVHVPFCSRRCDYCAFATWTDRSHLMSAYAGACRTELDRAVATGMPIASSVFFGGGTPSLLPAELLADVLAGVPRSPEAEVTVECNPENVSARLLRSYRDAGVTRLSFGVQSMDPAVLTALGREHDPAAVLRAAHAAGEEGFGDAYSVDLIFGVAGETVDQWRRSLETVLSIDPPPRHVSAYGLTVEPGTPLAATPDRHPDADDQADKYVLADDLLADAGLAWYEISNWARPGAECAHNRLYWDQGEYRGIGCAAHSHAVLADGRARRWWNVRTPERYIRLVGEGEPVEAAGEELTEDERTFERIVLGLRTREGVEVGGVPPEALDELRDAGLVTVGAPPDAAARVVLTLRGRLLANEVAVRLAPGDAQPSTEGSTSRSPGKSRSGSSGTGSRSRFVSISRVQ